MISCKDSVGRVAWDLVLKETAGSHEGVASQPNGKEGGIHQAFHFNGNERLK